MKLFVGFALIVGILSIGTIVWSKSIKTSSLNKPGSGTDYLSTGSDYQGNYIFGGAMQLAINELNNNILHGKLDLSLSPADSETSRILNVFNKSQFTTADLDSPSYYIKSGYGQNTVSQINIESRLKFPSKSFDDLKVTLDSKDFITYAYFLKEIEYKTAFESSSVQFQGQPVTGFKAASSDQRHNVQIVDYQDDDQFVIKLNLKNNSDEIYFAKGYSMTDPASPVKVINSHNKGEFMGDDDVFQAPEVHLDMVRNYSGFIDKYLKNPGFTQHQIKLMTENIKFDIDNKGARVENQAMIGVVGSALNSQRPKIKRLVLDKPYWIIMKRATSTQPYFVLGVNNTQILKK